MAGRNAGIWIIIMVAKGASYNWISQVRASAPEVSMAKAPIADLPVAFPDPAIAIRRGEPDLIEHEDFGLHCGLPWTVFRPDRRHGAHRYR